MQVDLVGYAGSTPHSQVLQDRNITLRHLGVLDWPGWSGVWYLLFAPIKVLYQLFQLLWLLFFTLPRPSLILVQTPPAIPSLLVAAFVARLRCAKLIVDWHNFGYTLLALKLGKNHPLVKISYWYERLVGRLSHSNLCVTEAMQDSLKKNWSITACVLYDRPPRIFRTLPSTEKIAFLQRMERDTLNSPSLFCLGVDALRPDRPALLVSSTSYTEDEDFSVLLDAVIMYDEAKKRALKEAGGEKKKQDAKQRLPDLVLLITGKGPMKDYYAQKIQHLKLSHARVVQAWLLAEDYPKLLGSSDLGISLHLSSSGLDLPMKVVDMFGCALPVCAINFPCLKELVIDDQNGRVFKDSAELAGQLQLLLAGFPWKIASSAQPALLRYRAELTSFVTQRWDDAWNATVKPLLP
eukprot:gb/GEZN01008261.1/.p1 GENE.gb/GEZN01008261.1/~~gb/GEZN01008261.1/.p1  ORF type:complete len:455 (-),score=40.74 gb/GEZN01008261.1/:84-1307(-)